jgi:outer membrane protein assembly factor BamB
MPRFALTASLGLLAGLLGIAAAADWPQWRGPDRTGRSADTGLLQRIPAGGPRLVWTFEQAGQGYSAPAVAGGRLYTLGADGRGTEEFVLCLDVATGKEVWRTPLKRLNNRTRVAAPWGAGPRSTPTVDGDAVYVLGARGDLAGLDAATGQLRWQKNLVGDFGGRVMAQWGYCESPLVDGGKLVCCPGSEDGTVAALDKATGEVLWRSQGLTDDASYASVVVAEVGGVRQYVVKTSERTAGVAAADGKLLWQEEVGVNPTAVIPTPVVRDDLVFTTCGYAGRGGTCGLIKLTPTGAGTTSEVVYENKNLINHHGGVVLVGEYLYGHGYDSDPDGWTCLELTTGNVVWTSDRLEKGSITYADGRLYCAGERTGTVVMIEPTPAGWVEHGRFTVPKKSANRPPSGQFWTHPVIADGKLFLRDQELLFCYDVRAKS